MWISCQGSGSPTVILEVGYDSSGIDGWFGFQSLVSETTRVCSYDRAGLGMSDPRPVSVGPVTSGLQADELHTLLGDAGIPPPYVLLGHSYGGMIVRLFAARYPDETAGMVLEDSSQEDEVALYKEAHAGPWIDGGAKIDITRTVAQLRAAGTLGAKPLVVVTAGIYEDVLDPVAEARIQDELATLSTDSVHVLAVGVGHFIHDERPSIVLEAVKEVVDAVRNSEALPPCARSFPAVGGKCLSG